MALGSALGGAEMVVVAATLLFSGGLVLYAAQSVTDWRQEDEDEPVDALKQTVAGQNRIALVVPEGPSIDALAAAMGLQTLSTEWGVTAHLFAEGPVTGEDSKTFCNIFDLELSVIGDGADELTDADAAIAVGGGGGVPRLSNNPPVVAVVRHRPTAEENILTVTPTDDGATATTVTRLLEEEGVVPDQRVATALLHGVRAGTREFRRANGQHDYEAAGFLHAYADLGRIEDLRSPGMSGDTFDVISDAIANRERRASFAVTNVGSVPSVSALEEAADTMLRLEGVSTAAVFGIHEETIVVSCRAEDVRTNAFDILDSAFGTSETTGGNTDAATARVPLGLFAQVDSDHEETLDMLIDASTRKALFEAFESS
ncbi:bifunctional oligoribonuclease/PAP phosphatase NrnA [Halorussus limi]|uniref:Bifunctional oligoribonuclease/PAP phosphatase NrnA n=1 Tax=Halorussus limi TaxID=2938695 RepID=A0A8U0HRM4_9EURY|nr:bifunctional oligoribonuclease/PAP phosphatase NrnA [Halorussus limi]UPV73324.1 bifunctional oligoribonuclease/PAP phosphatase NrnA [Halorussus limi]